jgi:large subunit ribosomal protein L21
MHAIVEMGGKQYKVAVGETIKVEKGSYETGATVNIDKVLAVVDGSNTICGTPYVNGAEVTAEAVGNGKSKKVLVYKQRPRKVYRKMRGHRQQFSMLKINEIRFGGNDGT